MVTHDVALNLRDLRCGYGNLKVLNGAEVRLSPGEFGLLAAPNGAGKTTLMNATAGLIRRSGTVDVFGTTLRPGVPEHALRTGLALVPENRQLFPDMSVGENLLMGSYIWRGRARAAVEEKLDAQREICLGLFPVLGQRLTQLAGTLSGGEQQMLAISRALMALPKVLLLDEPTLGLAPKIVENLRAALVELQRTGLTILVAEQNSRAFTGVATVTWELVHGRALLAPAVDDLGAPVPSAS